MAQSSTATESAAEQVLTALNPLTTTPTDSVVHSITAKIRKANIPHHVLATSIYVFSKLLDAIPATATQKSSRLSAFRNVVTNLTHSFTLPHRTLFEAIDANTHQMITPAINHVLEERRQRTRLWFTQTRFNLFREESEGYAKLISLLWDCMTTSIQTTSVVSNFLSLIGEFSLDSNRVIELVLSAAAHVIQCEINKDSSVPIDHRLPPLFALLLDEFARDHVYSVVGAMLQTYHAVPTPAADPDDSPAPDLHPAESVKTTQSLIALIAVMIREGRMHIADVWHHLSPRDNRVFAGRFLEYEKELLELSKVVCSSRALSTPAGEDSSKMPRPGTFASDRDIFSQYKLVTAGPLKQFSSQKLDLIIFLVCLCRWDDAMAAVLSLGVEDEHVDIAAHPSISSSFVNLAEILLNPLLHSMFPNLYPERKRLTDAIRKLGGRKNGYAVPIETVEEFLSESEQASGVAVRQMFQVLGPHARVSPRLLEALCRLLQGRHEKEAISIMRDVVLPASSLMQTNAGIANSIWNVLKEWPHTVRWELYGHLHNVVSTTCAAYQIVASRASYEMRYILKRLTGETQRHYTHAISKITHGQAIPAFTAALDRVQGYPRDIVTISPFIEACRGCTDLAVDMLLYLLIDRMADSRKNRLKEDGINTAQWYATLSLFLGSCLRKLCVTPQHIEGVLGFLYQKLVVDEEALLITALSDIIKCVADIDVDINLTAKQVVAHGGGHYLREVVSGVWSRLQPNPMLIGNAFDLKVEREKRVATSSLKQAFEQTGMHCQIAIAIAQLTKSAIYQENVRYMPLKLGANIVDMARTSLLQLSQFMDTFPMYAGNNADSRIDMWGPLCSIGLGQMIGQMFVPTSSAVILMAPTLDFVKEFQSQKFTGRKVEKTGSKDAVKDVKSVSPVQKGPSGVNKNAEHERKTEPKDGIEIESAQPQSSSQAGESPKASIDSMDCSKDEKISFSIQRDFSYIIARRTTGYLSVTLIRVFWILKLSDIAVPHQLYETEKKRIGTIKAVWEKENDRYRRHGDSDRVRRFEMELRRIREYAENLDMEGKEMGKRHSTVLDTLRNQTGDLCIDGAGLQGPKAARAVYLFLQECVLPRCKVSRPEALFCAKFVQLLLDLDIPSICFAEYFERFLKLVPLVLRSCSENEALSLSVLVKDVLSTLERWRSNRKAFENEASVGKKNGFRDREDGSKPMRHEQFCQWLFEIHQCLTDRFSSVLASDEYLYSRNSLAILAGIADVFPKVSEHSTKIEDTVQKLSKSDLADIRLASTGVLARLRAGKAKRLPQHIFKLKPAVSTSSAHAAKQKTKEVSPSEPQGGGKVVHKRKHILPGAKSKRLSPKKARESSSQAVLGASKEKMKPGSSKSSPATTPQAKHGKSPPSKSGDVNMKQLPSNSTASASIKLKANAKAANTQELNPSAAPFIPDEKKTINKTGSNNVVGKRNREEEEDSGPRPAVKDEPRKEDGFQSSDQIPSTKRQKKFDSKKPGPDSNMADRSQPTQGSGTKGSGPPKEPNASSSGRDLNSKHKQTPVSPGTRIENHNADTRDGSSNRGPEQKSGGQVPVKQEEALKPSVRDHINQSNPKDVTGADPSVKMMSPHNGGQGKRNVPPRTTTPPKRTSPPGMQSAGPSGHEQNMQSQRKLNENAGLRNVPPIDSGRDNGRNNNGPLKRDLRDGGGRDGNRRDAAISMSVKRENAIRDGNREPPRDGGGRNANGGPMGDGRKRRDGGYDYAGAGDGRPSTGKGGGGNYGGWGGGDQRNSDNKGGGDYEREHYGDPHGMKRRRDYGQRESYNFDGDSRRVVRPRVEGGEYDRARGNSGPGGGHDRRYNGAPSPRDEGRPGNFPPPVSNLGWVEGRGRHADAPPEGRGRGGRREDDDVAWQPRVEREFDNRAPPERGREDRDGEYHDRDRYRDTPRRDDRRERDRRYRGRNNRRRPPQSR